MNKRIFAFMAALALLLILALPMPGIADAGSFSGDTDFGGSDWGSSSWDSDWDSDWSSSSSSSSYSSSGSSDGGGESLPLAIVVVAIIIIVNLIKSKRGKKKSNGGSRQSTYVPGAQRTVLPMTIADLKAIDPDFSEEKMKEKIANLYLRMQLCWQNKTWEEMRTSMDDGIFNQFNMQLNNLAAAHRTNYMDNIAVLDVNLTGFGRDENNDIITAILRTRLRDYTVDDNTGAVVSGSKTAEKFMTYEWTLIRTKGAKTDVEQGTDAKHCPNCGAPLDLNATAKCSYCGAIITSSEHDWVIKGIKGISQQTSGR